LRLAKHPASKSARLPSAAAAINALIAPSPLEKSTMHCFAHAVAAAAALLALQFALMAATNATPESARLFLVFMPELAVLMNSASNPINSAECSCSSG
jgi:hypothetical protein